MKKRIFLTILAFVLTLSLCSCDYLDELKATQFIWTNHKHDGIISRDGKEYKLLPADTEIALNYRNSYEIGYLVEPDVPLLLGDLYGSIMYIYDDKPIIKLSGKSDSFFATIECYDEVLEFVNSNNGVYGFYFYNYVTHRYELCELGDTEMAAIETILKTTPKAVSYDKELFNDVSFYRVDTNLNIEQLAFDIGEIESKTITGETVRYIIKKTDDAMLLYSIPDDLLPLIESITDGYAY